MSTLSGERPQVDPSALLATLPAVETAAEEGSATGLSDLAPIRIHEAAPDLEGREFACTDFFTAACGLALGVGLTAGPLYPDLMALVRTWLPTRLRRGGSTPPARTARKRASDLLARWLGRRPR